jgi:hypothetical protein
MLKRAFEWCVRDRRTGRIVVAQWPNVPLGVYLAASLVRRLAAPEGTAGTALGVVATVALAGWAGDEVIRGVNPWRRALGATVAAGVVVGLLRR